MSDGAFLRVEGVVKRFGGHLALDDVSLTLDRGQVHAVIGPNGAGKSTLFGVISGEYHPERGRVLLGDRDMTRSSPRARVRMGLARAFQVARVFGELTVRDNITSAVLASSGATLPFRRELCDAGVLAGRAAPARAQGGPGAGTGAVGRPTVQTGPRTVPGGP